MSVFKLSRRRYRRWTSEAQEQATDMRAKGYSYDHIGIVLGYASETVSSHLDPESAKRHRTRVLAYRERKAASRPVRLHRPLLHADSVKRAPRAPKPSVCEPIVEEGFGRVSLMDARRDQCRNPLWTRQDTHRDVCGRRVALGRSFCPACLKRVYGPTPTFKEEARP